MRTSSFFWGFALIHFVVWVVLPVLTQPNYPLDVVESYIYGGAWALSSGKHPPMPAWCVEGMSVLTGRSEFAPYLCGQISVFLVFFSIWRLSLHFVSPMKALLAICALEFYPYTACDSLEFNNTICLLGFWCLAVLGFYNAITTNRMRYWIATGLCLGLAVLSKYTGFILAFFMVFYLIYEPGMRKYWKTSGPWITTLIAFLIFLPHFLTVVSTHFSTLDYAMDRVTMEEEVFAEAIYFPLRFIATQLGIITPILVFFLVITQGWFRLRKRDENDAFPARFLATFVLGPFFLETLISVVFQIHLTTVYGAHIWLLLSLFLAFFLEIDEKKLSFKKLGVLTAIAMMVMVSIVTVRNIASPYLRHKPSRIHYPGREIAEKVETLWREYDPNPCRNLVGEWWLTGNVVAYGKDHPRVFAYADYNALENQDILTTWTTPDAILRTGGMCVWNTSHYPDGVPPTLFLRYPNAKVLPPFTVTYLTAAELPPLEIGVAIIPASGSSGE